MRHYQRRRRNEFDREITVRHGVKGILANAVKTQLRCHGLAVDRIAGAGKGRRTQWRAVQPFTTIHHPGFIARQHFNVSHDVVPKCHRLGHLQMGKAGHDGVGMLLGQSHHRQLHRTQQRNQAIDLAAQPKPDISRNLVVP